MEQVGVIIVAGGTGSRMGSKIPKQFMFIDGKPLLVRTINRFAEALPNAQIIVTLPKEHIDYWKDLKARFDVSKHRVMEGGQERFHSVRNGVISFGDNIDYIAVHDGVRPLVSCEVIENVLSCAIKHGAAVPVIHPVDSLRRVDESGGSQVVDRSEIRIVQTPQIFAAKMLSDAYDVDYSPQFTDDASVVEFSGGRVTLCDGDVNNIKVTTLKDLLVAEAILENQELDNK